MKNTTIKITAVLLALASLLAVTGIGCGKKDDSLVYKKNGKIYVRSGAGIVYDSVPEKEYQECINKAAAVVKAIESANEL